MANVEDLNHEIKLLRESNKEMVQKVQFWKMKCADQESEKLSLMKEINDLKLKVIRMRNGGAAQTRALDAALQETSEEALSHLVQASSAVARTLQIAKNYMSERQELESYSSRWSNLSVTPGSQDKVQKVPPTLIGGRSTQPFVSLRRVSLTNVPSEMNNQNISDRVLPLPMHILQDVYIPLRRIDREFNIGVPDNDDNIQQDNDELLLEENDDNADNSQNISLENNLEMSRQLEVLHEESEAEMEQPSLSINGIDNPLEGPSWLLDNIQSLSPVLMKVSKRGRSNKRVTLEADSTTLLEETSSITPPCSVALPTLSIQDTISGVNMECRAFTPTVRRRKRTSSPPPPLPPSPPTSTDRCSVKSRASGRVLKVMVPKMRLESLQRGPPGGGTRGGGGGGEGDGTPPSKRVPSFDAPSPNGATDSALIEVEQSQNRTVVEHASEQDSNSAPERDSDSGSEGPSRPRRPRKKITYKDIPLNRKMRR